VKFRKKPVVIEAVQFVYTQESIDQLREFCGSALGKINKARSPFAKGWAEIGLRTDRENFTVNHIAHEDDWIIKTIDGEFYTCKPSIFSATYEMITNL